MEIGSNLQTYFAYFDYMINTDSELLGKSAAHILYLIDKDGKIQTPTLTGSYYYNLIDRTLNRNDPNLKILDNLKFLKFLYEYHQKLRREDKELASKFIFFNCSTTNRRRQNFGVIDEIRTHTLRTHNPWHCHCATTTIDWCS